ncbi:zinc ABC transporter substrate-binding protein, partial [Candidatus Sumerlaeota bacterium]|nr:zinc ABC transporter substrate-binding protein [Candidatus Sumerlaeota bacterium]
MKTPRSVFISRAALLTVTLAAISSCGPKVKTSASRSLVVTIHPLAAILREIVGGKFEIVTLVPPGASPHTFDPRPSEARAVESAQAFFWIDPNLDGWAAKLDCPKKFAMMDLLPGEFRVFIPESESLDPHFWTDPLAVKAVLPSLLKIVVECDPEGRQSYEANAARFAADLDRLNQQVQARLSGVTSRTVVLFHPSFRYLLRRYG